MFSFDKKFVLPSKFNFSTSLSRSKLAESLDSAKVLIRVTNIARVIKIFILANTDVKCKLNFWTSGFNTFDLDMDRCKLNNYHCKSANVQKCKLQKCISAKIQNCKPVEQ